MRNSDSPPIYAQVAYDIAMKIVSGEFKCGQRFSGRSLMGSRYGVSPETIRRAMRMLSDMGITSTRPNVGSVVESPKRAAEFVSRFENGKNYLALRTKLQKLIAQRNEIDRQITDTVNQIIDISERFRSSDILRTYEFTIEAGSAAVSRTIGDIRFRQETGATIVAVRHGEDILLSPGPETVLCQGDVLVVACALGNLTRVSEYLDSLHTDSQEPT